MTIQTFVKSFVDGLTADAKAVEDAIGGKLVTEVETHIPSLGPLLGEIAKVAGKVSGYGQIASWLLDGIQIAQAIGVQPMDANQMAKDDEKFHPGYSAD